MYENSRLFVADATVIKKNTKILVLTPFRAPSTPWDQLTNVKLKSYAMYAGYQNCVKRVHGVYF